MIACGRCGLENAASAKFCQACGASLATEAAPNRERKLVSVVFVDVVGSTKRGEEVDPEDLKDELGRVFQPVREQAEHYGGTVEKFIGDAAVVVFGAPTAHGDDSERAVRCALGIVQAVNADPRHKLQVRAGVSTGEAVVALGSAFERGEALATGDVMNTAARLQAAARPGQVAVGPTTYAATRRRIRYQPLPPLELKGKAERVPAWLALGPLEQSESGAPSTAMVGREKELSLLEQMLETAINTKQPKFLTVVGEAGIGKSRLASEFGRRAEEQGVRRVVGRCLPFDRGGGYPASVRQVEALAGILETDAAEVASAKLRELVAQHLPTAEVAEVARFLSLLMGLGAEAPAAARQPLFFALRRLFESLATERPLLLVIEDLHWAGPSQRELLDYLRATLREVPVLGVALTRPGATTGDVVELEPLDASASGVIVESLLGGADATRVSRLVEAAGGNPLFLEELATNPAGSQGALPATVREAIAARLDALPQAPRALLMDASVVGPFFWRGLLAEVDEGRDIDGQLRKLIEEGLVQPLAHSRVAGDIEYAFKHVLIRDVAYETLPKAVRKARHLAIAGHMERVAGSAVRDLAAILAHHWRQGGDIPKAIDNLLIAGERARDAWATTESEAQFAEALELAGEDIEARTQIQYRLGQSLVQLSEYERGATVLDEILPRLEGQLEVEALIARSRIAYWLESTAETRLFADLARQRAEEVGDLEQATAAIVYQIASAYFEGDMARATELGDEASRRWVPGSRPIDLAGLHEFRADVAYWTGHYAAAEKHATSAFGVGGEAHSIEPVLRSGGWRGLTMAAQGRSEEAIAWLDGIIRQAHDLDSKWGAGSYNYSSLAFRDMFQLKEARRRNEMSLDLVARRGAYGMPEMQAEIDIMLVDLAEGNPGPVQVAWPGLWDLAINGNAWRPWLGGGRLALVRAELARQTEGPQETATAAADAIERARSNGRVKYEAAGRAILGPALMALDRHDEGLAELRRAVALADDLGAPTGRWQFRSSLGEALYRTGEDDAAKKVYGEGAEIIRDYAKALTPEHAAHFLRAEPVASVLKLSGQDTRAPAGEPGKVV